MGLPQHPRQFQGLASQLIAELVDTGGLLLEGGREGQQGFGFTIHALRLRVVWHGL